MRRTEGKYETPESRWAGLGPYYAMFPVQFADRVIATYTDEGDAVLDPFSGRGTALFSAAAAGRHGLGVEINPVGWVYSSAKLAPAARRSVDARITELGKLAPRFRDRAKQLPTFFQLCFSPNVQAFLLAARRHLDWRHSVVDRTVMALLLVDLHGKRTAALSNQMRQTKAMSPDYAIRWWRERELGPPDRDPVEFMRRKIAWRYSRGLPRTSESKVYLADSTHRLVGLRTTTRRLAPKGARLLFTSPPYLGITNYHYDQWLRLWLLGGAPSPRSLGDKHRGKFAHRAQFSSLLLAVFVHARSLLARDGIVYVRTDRRKATAQLTEGVLRTVFPSHSMKRRVRPVRGVTQTRLFGNRTQPDGEVDLVLVPS